MIKSSDLGSLFANPRTGYYSPVFASFQQKEISGFLTKMWHADPFKAKWSILAKSWSVIRDNKGKDQAPLTGFLTIAAPLMGVLEPDQYLQTMGWDTFITEDGHPIIQRNDKPIDERLFTTNLSVNDVIRHSYHQGYFTGNLFDVLLSENEAAMTMAASLQPTENGQLSSFSVANGEDTEAVANTHMEGVEGTMKAHGMMGLVDDSVDENNPVSGTSEVVQQTPQDSNGRSFFAPTNSVVGDRLLMASSSSEATETVNTSTTLDRDNSAPITVASINSDSANVQQLTQTAINNAATSTLAASNYQLHSEYPFNPEFDPDFEDIFTWDPFLGNQFDTFEMSDMNDVNWDNFVNFNA